MTPSRAAAAAAALACAAAGASLAGAPMRITLANAALRIDDSWMRPAALVLAALAALAVAAALPPRRLHRGLLAACAGALLLGAANVATASLEAGPEALAVRRWFVRTAIPWNDISRVDARHDGVTVWAASGAAADFDATRLSGEQRAMLDRTLARRVRETASAR